MVMGWELECGNVGRRVKEFGELLYYILVFLFKRRLCILNYIFEI